jgi:hypothetical protein
MKSVSRDEAGKCTDRLKEARKARRQERRERMCEVSIPSPRRRLRRWLPAEIFTNNADYFRFTTGE